MDVNQSVSREEWLQARQDLLTEEKSVRLQLDALAQRRCEMPWVRVDKEYVFQTESGSKSLADLFAGKSQLVVYHFMFAPGATEGCPSCSFVCDHLEGANLHLKHHDIQLTAVSRAPLADSLPFRERLGWKFDWVSSAGADFNFDYGVSFTHEQIAEGSAFYNYRSTGQVAEEMPGISVFVKTDSGEVFHTYSTYTRGLDLFMGAHNLLDLTPKGRDEEHPMSWVRYHDRYEKVVSNPLQVQAAERDCCSNK